ncbi:hypothetical protein QN277_011115 [Acacia crassicarpa]|uniref:NAC domain-containing protein n=1 Tax=Acacia crassicarpa TaxID=499986 RepID=A0AAE1TB52_9FABA|nr:hypothetical protein QN277_011115 [Acacia crassicarpa]
MQKLPSFVVNGGIKLPIGYYFCPTDEEFVIHYLNRKAFSHPLPASVIPDVNVFAAHPRRLLGPSFPPNLFLRSHYFGRSQNVLRINNVIPRPNDLLLLLFGDMPKLNPNALSKKRGISLAIGRTVWITRGLLVLGTGKL